MTVVVVVVVAVYEYDDSTDGSDDDDGWCRCSDTIPVTLATPFVALVRLCGTTILISRAAITLSLSIFSSTYYYYSSSTGIHAICDGRMCVVCTGKNVTIWKRLTKR